MACGVSRRCPQTMRLARWSPPGRRQSRSATAIPTPPVARGGSAERECEESVPTGDSLPAENSPSPSGWHAAGRAELPRTDGDGDARRFRHRSGSRLRRRGAVRADRSRARGASTRHRIPGRAAQVLRDSWSRRLRPFGWLSIRGDLGNRDVRCLHRRYGDRLHRRYGIRPGSGRAALDGGLGLRYLGVAEVRERRRKLGTRPGGRPFLEEPEQLNRYRHDQRAVLLPRPPQPRSAAAAVAAPRGREPSRWPPWPAAWRPGTRRRR